MSLLEIKRVFIRNVFVNIKKIKNVYLTNIITILDFFFVFFVNLILQANNVFELNNNKKKILLVLQKTRTLLILKLSYAIIQVQRTRSNNDLSVNHYKIACIIFVL